jgi:putative oxidoreductase
VKARTKEIVDNRRLIFALRVALGGIFVAASIAKLLHQTEFVDAVTRYGILPSNLAHLYGHIIPWLELFIGCSLVLGIFSRLASIISVPLIVSFIVANVYSLFHSGALVCSCLGTLILLSHPISLATDAVMLAIAVQLLFHRDKAEFWGLGPLLCRRKPESGRTRRFIRDKAIRFAVVGLAMLMVAVISSHVWTQSSPNTVITDGASGSNNGGTQNSTDTGNNSGAPGSNNGGTQSSLDMEIDSALNSGKPAFLCLYWECTCQCEGINDLESEYGDRIVFIHIDCEDNPQAKEEFKVTIAFPTMLLITGKNDKGEYVIYQRFEYAVVDKAGLRNIFDEVLRNSGH